MAGPDDPGSIPVDRGRSDAKSPTFMGGAFRSVRHQGLEPRTR